MKLTFEFCGRSLECDLSQGSSIAIEMDFSGKQPIYFGAPTATATPVSGEGFVGSVSEGFCCNFDTLNMIPHCNGTHTESVGHIVEQVGQVPLSRILSRTFYPAILVSISPELESELRDEDYRPALEKTDRVISKRQLEKVVDGVLKDCDASKISQSEFAIVVRTTPNGIAKKSAVYGDQNNPPFFTATAMRWLSDMGVSHLLVDTPSVDRANDEGLLTNHHIFWNVVEGTNQLTKETHRDKTITEMIFVDDELPDGIYGLDIQAPSMMIDAAPSRPMLYSTRQV